MSTPPPPPALPPPVDYPPEWLTESRSGSILAANIILHVISTIFVAGRIFSRACILRQFKSDDYILVAAWVLGTGVSITSYYSVSLGLGHHGVTIPLENVIKLQQTGFAAQLLFIAVLPVVKLSMCISYRRVFHSNKMSRIILTSVIVLLILTGIAFEFISIFQCHPIHNFWTLTRENCLDIQPAFYVNGISNLFTDVLLILLIIPQILKLKMNVRQKSALISVVCLGWLAVIAGIVRMARVAHTLAPGVDAAWDGFDITIWTALEVHVSLFCAATPAIRPLILKIMPGFLGSTISGSSVSHPTKRRSAVQLVSMKKGNVTTRTLPSQDTIRTGTSAVDRVPGARNSWMALGGDADDRDSLVHDESGVQRPEQAIVIPKNDYRY